MGAKTAKTTPSGTMGCDGLMGSWLFPACTVGHKVPSCSPCSSDSCTTAHSSSSHSSSSSLCSTTRNIGVFATSTCGFRAGAITASSCGPRAKVFLAGKTEYTVKVIHVTSCPVLQAGGSAARDHDVGSNRVLRVGWADTSLCSHMMWTCLSLVGSPVIWVHHLVHHGPACGL